MPDTNIQVCSRCVYDETVPRIEFDDEGVCNYCHLHDDLDRQYPIGEEGERRLQELVAEIKASARGRKYDCVVGVSGGCDSSYLLVRMVELGLRPLAVHFDNTWNSPIATQNIYKVIEKLGVDLDTYVVDNREYDDILRSFMLSGAMDLEAPTDLGLAAVLYRTAHKHGLKYIIEGHSFRTEGVAPLGWVYMDGRYISSVHRQFGRRKMKTYPLMTLSKFIYWTVGLGIRRVRPLYYMRYDKEAVKKRLQAEYGWEWYGGHHLDNRFTAFYIQYALPRRWNTDLRYLGHAAHVRTGDMLREEALADLKKPADCPEEILRLVKKRFEFDDADFERVMTQPRRTWRDFPNYKRSFERLRPLFGVLVRLGRVPESFYLKFCFPNELGEAGEKVPDPRPRVSAPAAEPLGIVHR
jgi:N-acetyl sugar amidotransferase